METDSAQEESSSSPVSDATRLCSICHVPVVLEHGAVVPFRDCRTRRWFLESSHSVAPILSCGHTFHVACLGEWFRRSTTCPNCRFEVRGSRLLMSPGRVRCLETCVSTVHRMHLADVEPVLFALMTRFDSTRFPAALTYVVLHGPPVVWIRGLIVETARRAHVLWSTFAAALEAALETRRTMARSDVDVVRSQQGMLRMLRSRHEDEELPDFIREIPVDGITCFNDRDAADAEMLLHTESADDIVTSPRSPAVVAAEPDTTTTPVDPMMTLYAGVVEDVMRCILPEDPDMFAECIDLLRAARERNLGLARTRQLAAHVCDLYRSFSDILIESHYNRRDARAGFLQAAHLLLDTAVALTR